MREHTDAVLSCQSWIISPNAAPLLTGAFATKLSTSTNPATSSPIRFHQLPAGRVPTAVAWAGKLGHLRAMVQQRPSESDSADDPAGQGSRGHDAPLKLEKFLPYQLNV